MRTVLTCVIYAVLASIGAASACDTDCQQEIDRQIQELRHEEQIQQWIRSEEQRMIRNYEQAERHTQERVRNLWNDESDEY